MRHSKMMIFGLIGLTTFTYTLGQVDENPISKALGEKQLLIEQQELQILSYEDSLTFVKSAIDSLKKLQPSLESEERENKQALSLLKKRNGNNPLTTELDSLCQREEDLLDSISKFQNGLNTTLAQEQEILGQKIDSLTNIRDSLNAELNDLQAQTNELADFGQAHASDLIASYDDKWSKCSFGVIDSEQFNQFVIDFNKYRNDSPDIASRASALDKLYNQYTIYSKGVDLLNSKYDRQKISEVGKALTTIVPNLSGKRLDEVNDLITRLRAYRFRVIDFQSLITEVDNSPEIPGSIRDGSDSVLADIRQIPWLSKQLDAYLSQIQKNKESRGGAKQIIQEIQLN